MAELDASAPARASVPFAQRAAALRRYGIVFGFVGLFVTLAILSPAFLTARNLLNILDQAAPVGIIAVGATLVIISGSFDLSVGAIYALAAVTAAIVTNAAGVPAGLAAALAAGIAVGLANSVLVSWIRINSFVATLASSLMIRGIAAVLTAGFIITVADPVFRSIGRADLLGARTSVWIFLAVALICALILHASVMGRFIYAVGGNAEAARLSGIRVGVVRTFAFVVSGVTAAIAGVVAATRVSSGQADMGTGIELTAIAAVVIGGTSILGGEGAVWRTVLGVLLLTLISNGFNILGIDPFYRTIFQGGIIVLAVSVDALSRREG